jgi:hypothetical protein
MQNYEVEVKSLLGSPERAAQVLAAIKAVDPQTKLTSKNKQLNHYFEGGDLARLQSAVAAHLSESGREKLADLVARANTFSIRTRDKDGTVILVVKASVGSDTSANGVSRLEFEEVVPMTLDHLDQILVDAGFTYQTK